MFSFFKRIPNKKIFNSLTNPALRSQSIKTFNWSPTQSYKPIYSYPKSSLLYLSCLAIPQANSQRKNTSASLMSIIVMALVAGGKLTSSDSTPPTQKRVIYKKPENTTTIRIWYPSAIFHQEFGHVAIETEDSYLSFRPGYTRNDVQNQSYQKDVEIMGRECNKVYHFYTLDTREISKRMHNFAKSDFENTGIFDHEKQHLLSEQIVGIPYNQWRTQLQHALPKDYHEIVFDWMPLGLKPDKKSQEKICMKNWYNLLFVHFILSVPPKIERTTIAAQKLYVAQNNQKAPFLVEVMANPIVSGLIAWTSEMVTPGAWLMSLFVGNLLKSYYVNSESNKYSLDEQRLNDLLWFIQYAEETSCELIDADADSSNQPAIR